MSRMTGASTSPESVPDEIGSAGEPPEASAGAPQDPSGEQGFEAPEGPGAPEDQEPVPTAPGAGGDEALERLRGEHETLRGQYMRMAADFDNFRKRQQRDAADQRLQITCSALGAILPVVDNFERARQQLDPQGDEAQALHRSYQGLYKQLVEALKDLGVAPMRVQGEPFDPNLHEAVLREPSDDYAEDVVIEELQRGYQLETRVLRHALVKVSMGPGPATDRSDPGAD